MSAVDDVVRAVVAPGPVPSAHRQQLRRLAREWRPLAIALAWLLVEHGEQVPAEWRHLEGGLGR